MKTTKIGNSVIKIVGKGVIVKKPMEMTVFNSFCETEKAAMDEYNEQVLKEEMGLSNQIRDARELLKREGYCVDSLWHTADVCMSLNKLDDEGRKNISKDDWADILDESVNNEYIMENINDRIYQNLLDRQ